MVWGRRPDLYVPITMQQVIEPEWSYLNDHRAYWLNIVGRLRTNETLPHASASLSSLWDSLRSKEFALQRDQSAQGARKVRLPLSSESGRRSNGFSPYRGEMRTPLLIMMAMVLLVMAMAVVNVAGLLLVRAAGRVREFSMRFALGATKWQILRQLLAEGLLLGIASARAWTLPRAPNLKGAHRLDGWA